MDPPPVHHGGPAPRVPSSFSEGSLDGFLANISHLPPLLSESVTLDSLSSKSSIEIVPPAFPLSKVLPRCVLLGLGENLKFFSEPARNGGSARRSSRVAISSPTSPRLRTMLKECLSIRQWAESSAGWQAPGHKPWSDLDDKATIPPWTSEGSVFPADFLSVALLQARARRNLTPASQRVFLSSATPADETLVDDFPGMPDEFDDDGMVDIMQELAEFQYYFETLPMEPDLDSQAHSHSQAGKASSGPTLAVPSLVISDSHFTFPLALESSNSLSVMRPVSTIARRRGKPAPAPLLSPSKTLVDIAYPDIPTAFLGSPSKESSSALDSPSSSSSAPSVPRNDLESALRYEEMIHNLRLQCATMEINNPTIDSALNSRSTETARDSSSSQRSDLPVREGEKPKRGDSTSESPIRVEKASLLRQPTKRAPTINHADASKKIAKPTTPSPPAAPQKPKPSSPTRKPPPTRTPADLTAERRVLASSRDNTGSKKAIANSPIPLLLPIKPRSRPPPLDLNSRSASPAQTQSKGSKLPTPQPQTPPKASPTTVRKPHSPPAKLRIPSKSLISKPIIPISDADTINNVAQNTANAPAAPILRSALMKKGRRKSTTYGKLKTVRFALSHEEVESDDSLWSGPPVPVVEILKSVAPFAKAVEEKEDIIPMETKTVTTASPLPAASSGIPSLLHRSGSLVRKASWRVLPSTRNTPDAKPRPHSVAVESPLRQSMTIPDPPDSPNAPSTVTTVTTEDDDSTPLIGLRRTTHSLGRHSLSRIMNMRGPMFSGSGSKSENKRATIAFSGSSSVGVVDENAMRRVGGDNSSLLKKSRMPVPLRNILTRFK